MAHTKPGKVDMDGSDPDVKITLTMSQDRARRLVHTAAARAPANAPAIPLELAVMMALVDWSKLPAHDDR